jgi:hypothetical protein
MGSTAANSKHHGRLKDFVSWFEIPAFNLPRAAAFYNTIFNMEMETTLKGEYAMAFFPAEDGIGGAIVAGPGCIPSSIGPLIYLNAGNDIESVLGRVELAGGSVIMPKTLISQEAGSFALFIDCEGNRLALHEGPTRVGPASKPARKAAQKAATAKKPAAQPGAAAKKSARKPR